MRSLQLRRISLAVLCALPVAASAGQGLRLKPDRTLVLTPPAVEEDLPVFLEADRLEGRGNRESRASGDVRLRRRGQVMRADRLRYDHLLEEVTAEGHVQLQRGADVIEGERLQYNLASGRGAMEQPTYALHRSRPPEEGGQVFREIDGRGEAKRLLFEGPGRYSAESARFTTCGPDNDDWYLRADRLDIDKSRDVGVARNASVVFMDVPILYSPYLSFSLGQQRKSGFITPHYGSSDKGGIELTVPYYWNIAPNRDTTISPRIMSRRGVLVSNEFRYLEPHYSGNLQTDLLPEDSARNGERRWAYRLRHDHAFAAGWRGSLDLQKVSDDTYFTDLSTEIATTSQILLPRQGSITRYGDWGGAGHYGLSALVQRWQTLQVDPLAVVVPPYNRLPQVTLNAARQDLPYTDFEVYGHYVGFDHPTKVNGSRLLAYPSLSLPLQTSYAYFTPKIGVNATRYALDPTPGGVTQETRILPVLTADTGVVLERPLSFRGTSFLQTLEPRAYYVYIPYEDQSRIPVFDSGQQDINFATIFAENQFAGWDRINDANQVTFGVSSRLIEPDSGAERMRAGVAQRYYFATQRVTLPGVPARTSTSSDLLAVISGTLTRGWTAEAGFQYSTNFSQTQRFNVGTRYQPRPGRVLNLSYRETLDVLRQTDVSAQWPLGRRWTALARWNYSLRERRTLEGLAGAEYNGDCWVLRIVAHRFAIATQEASTTLFVQLELNGVSRIGSNPMETLKRNIGGYMALDPRLRRPEGPLTPYPY